jgi:multicomponent Na+:H+ antiporter subunit G
MATFLTLAGLALYSGFNTHSVKLILAIVFIWLTNPTAAHLISKAATHLDSTKGSFYGKNI